VSIKLRTQSEWSRGHCSRRPAPAHLTCRKGHQGDPSHQHQRFQSRCSTTTMPVSKTTPASSRIKYPRPYDGPKLSPNITINSSELLTTIITQLGMVADLVESHDDRWGYGTLDENPTAPRFFDTIVECGNKITESFHSLEDHLHFRKEEPCR